MGAFSLKDRSHMADDLAMVFDMFPRLKERRNQRRARFPAVSSRC